MNTDDEIEAAYDRGREAGVDSCEPQIEDLRAEIQTLQSRLDTAREALCQIANGIPGPCLHATETLQAIAVERQSPKVFAAPQSECQSTFPGECPKCGRVVAREPIHGYDANGSPVTE